MNICRQGYLPFSALKLQSRNQRVSVSYLEIVSTTFQEGVLGFDSVFIFMGKEKKRNSLINNLSYVCVSNFMYRCEHICERNIYEEITFKVFNGNSFTQMAFCSTCSKRQTKGIQLNI